MFKRLHSKALLPIFLILLVVFLILEYGGGKAEKGSIPNTLGSIDTSKVSRMIIHQEGKKEGIELVKTKDGWKMKKGNKSYPASEEKVENSLKRLKGLSPKELVSSDSNQWKKYKVAQGRRIEVLHGKDDVGLHLYIGKMSVKKPNGKGGKRRMMRRRRPAIEFNVRRAGEPNTYKVKGRPLMAFRRGHKSWIDKTLIEGDQKDWTKVAFRSADSSLTLRKEQDGWIAEGGNMDSASLRNYLRQLSGLSGNMIAEKTDLGSEKASIRSIIERKGKNAIRVKAYPAKKDTTTAFYFQSSINPELTFRAPDSSLFKKLIPGGSSSAPSPSLRKRQMRRKMPN